MRRLLAVSAVLALLVGLTPTTGAYHLSVGTQDSVLVGPEESVEERSLPPGSGQPDANGTLYERGLVTDCYEPNGSTRSPSAVVGEAQRAAEADPFCGRLVYEEGTTFEQESPVDQDIRVDEWSFDVVATGYVGNYGLGTCLPWCFFLYPYEILHNVGQDHGLTDDGETARRGDNGWQEFAVNLRVPHASTTATQASGQWQGNGWMLPVQDQSFLGFLEDEDGPVGPDELATAVSARREAGTLIDEAQPLLCGFAPGTEVSPDDPIVPSCEIPFEFSTEAPDGVQDGRDLRPQDYQDPCDSPAYVCGANQEAWTARIVCPAARPVCDDPSAFDSTRDYVTWHWVVAPTPSACEAEQEPGFLSATDDDADPYLAHDLDVYTTPGSPVAEETRGTSGLEAYTAALANSAIDEVSEQFPSVPPPFPGDPDSWVAKDHRVEPNADGDTSQSQLSGEALEREPVPCSEIVESLETEATIDPWVDVVDSRLVRDAIGDVSEGPGDAKDPYLTSWDHQDASNRPGPGQYFPEGKVGVFTDKDDDGEYDQAEPYKLFSAIPEKGAYPMFWDMHLNDTGQREQNLGCSPGFINEGIDDWMEEAGYGPLTGLIQVLYLTHPTYWFNWDTWVTIETTHEEAAYVFLNDALHELRDQGNESVEAAIDDALMKLPGVDSPDDVETVYLADRIGSDNDFDDQCTEPTGGFTNEWGFYHDARAGSGGDTIVTEYLWDNQAPDGQIGVEGDVIPAFRPDGEAYAFPTGLNQWFDVDPIDGDASRNDRESSAPPTGS